LVDTRGLSARWYAEHFLPALEQSLGRGVWRLEHPDRGLVFFSLVEYRRTLERNSPARLEALARAERDRTQVLWLYGLDSYEPVGYEWRSRWGGPKGGAVIVNPTDHPVAVRVRCRFRTAFSESATICLRGAVWAADLEVSPDGTPYEAELTIPPGRHRVTLSCRPAAAVLPTDSRNHLYVILDFRWDEIAR
jgi:hypothetical protein